MYEHLKHISTVEQQMQLIFSRINNMLDLVITEIKAGHEESALSHLDLIQKSLNKMSSKGGE